MVPRSGDSGNPDNLGTATTGKCGVRLASTRLWPTGADRDDLERRSDQDGSEIPAGIVCRRTPGHVRRREAADQGASEDGPGGPSRRIADGVDEPSARDR